LTWVGQWQIPPRPEFTNIPRAEITEVDKYWLNYGNTVFPKCSKEVIERCISSMEFKKQGGSEWTSANFLKYLPVTTLPFTTNNRDRYVEWAKQEVAFGKLKRAKEKANIWRLFQSSMTLGKKFIVNLS
jgi:hypothetical protein